MTTETQSFQLRPKEFRRALRRIYWSRTAALLAILWALAAYLLIGELDVFSWQALGRALAVWYPLLGLALFWPLWMFLLQPAIAARSPASRPLFRGCRLRFEDQEFVVDFADGSYSRRPGSALRKATLTDGLLLLEQDTGQFLIVPQRAFADPQAPRELAASINRRASAAAPGAPPSSASPATPWQGLRRNLAAAVRLMLFRQVARDDFTVSTDQALLLGLLSFLLYLGMDYLRAAGDATFNEYGIGSVAAGFLLTLIAAYLVARSLKRGERTIGFVVLLLAVEAIFAVVFAVIEMVPLDAGEEAAWPQALFVAPLVWLLATWYRGIKVAFSAGKGPAALALLLYVAIALIPLWFLPTSELWYADYAAEQEAPRLNVEEVFYAQQPLLASRLAALEPERPGTVDLYHLGFAAYAHQQVFRREVSHIQSLLDQRFDTRGRSLVLVNHQATVGFYPIASKSNLLLALRGIAQRMNPDEDVLLLYLTSHGSSEGLLSVDFWPLDLNQLTAPDLRSALDAAGIRWRVVVISACYSGSFVDALKDEHTLVITAASPDRQSFGCDNRSQYTYFGEAFFDHALRQTFSFAEAFTIAKDLLRKREQAEGRDPSEPVLWSGAAIRGQLDRLQERLRTTRPALP